MTKDDERRLAAIAVAATDRERATLLREYYGDADRADRASRELLYLHLGLLTGMVLRLVEETEAPR